MKKKAILDVCGTIYSSNTTFDFFESIASSPLELFIIKIKRCKILMLANSILFKLLKFDFYRRVCVYIFLANKTAEEVEYASIKFYNEFLSHKKINETQAVIKDLSDEYEFIICSASIDPIISVVAENIGCKVYFSTLLERKNGVYSGGIAQDLLGNKLSVLRENDINYDLVITDNKSDMDIIKNSKSAIIITEMKNLKYWNVFASINNHVNIKVVSV